MRDEMKEEASHLHHRYSGSKPHDDDDEGDSDSSSDDSGPVTHATPAHDAEAFSETASSDLLF